ncbi:MAG TPA: hypothetical protein VLL98_01060 [Rickettsiales bacterium]|nr:hypothetical protein [Rickettsiales bacterium]
MDGNKLLFLKSFNKPLKIEILDLTNSNRKNLFQSCGFVMSIIEDSNPNKILRNVLTIGAKKFLTYKKS